MSRVLLADDSAHAQRMGEFILREEGFEIVSVTDGATAMVRLADVDPDLVLADVSLPGHNGYELCRLIKSHPKHSHVKVVLTAGAQEPIDDGEAGRAGADGRLHKPFEASAVIELAHRLAGEAREARLVAGEPAGDGGSQQPPDAADAGCTPGGSETEEAGGTDAPAEPAGVTGAATPGADGAELPGAAQQAIVNPVENAETWTAAAPLAPPDPEAVRAAVTLALESALPVLIDEITQRVTVALIDAAAQSQRAGESGESGGAQGT